MAGVQVQALVGRARKYGGRFQGFGDYLREEAGSLADVTIVAPDGTTHKAHKLLLAYHSEFFRRAFAADFKEKEEQRVVLGFDDPAGVWRMMLDFFYTDEVVLTDETVLPLLAMSRELMVKSIEDYCSDYAQNSLEASNAIQYLNQAVQFNCDSFRESCVALVAEGFPASFNKPTDGLPSEVMLEVLNHPNLVVQTEEQVLTFVLNYVPRHELPADIIRKLYEQVRFTFLSNERLASLAQEDTVPKDLLLTAMATRFSLIDHPERLAALMALSQGNGMTASPPSPSLPPRPRRQSSNTGSGSTSGAPPREPMCTLTGDSATANALAAVGIPMPSCTHPLPTSPMPTAFQTGSSSSNTQRVSHSGGSGSNSALLSPITLTLPPQLGNLPLGALPGMATASSNPHSMLPRKTYICSIEYGLPGGSEYASVPLHEVWEDLVPQMQVRVSGDVVEGDAQSILRVHDQDSSWFMVSGEAGAQQPVWIEIELPANMRVVDLTKYTFSHGMNFANHMFPYGISDSAWFQMKGLFTQVSEGDSDHFYPLRTSESSNSSMQFEYTVVVDSSAGGGGGQRVPPWRRLRISTNEEQSNGNVRLSIRKLRLYGRVEISLTREGPPGGRDVLACWRRRKEAAAARQQVASRKSLAHNLGHNI